jgi:murein DD-endopeptidase MepM/ murein hydrolase activator NlpD
VHPITGARKFHNGIDYGGTFPVLLAGRAKIVKVGFVSWGLGNYVIAEHTPTLRTVYGHGAHRSKLVPGRIYVDGVTVYTSGTTGASTGNHLHFEVRRRNRWGVWVAVNPEPYLQAPPKPSNPKLEQRKRKTWLG